MTTAWIRIAGVVSAVGIFDVTFGASPAEGCHVRVIAGTGAFAGVAGTVAVTGVRVARIVPAVRKSDKAFDTGPTILSHVWVLAVAEPAQLIAGPVSLHGSGSQGLSRQVG